VRTQSFQGVALPFPGDTVSRRDPKATLSFSRLISPGRARSAAGPVPHLDGFEVQRIDDRLGGLLPDGGVTKIEQKRNSRKKFCWELRDAAFSAVRLSRTVLL
jgi:hypothetical protein